MGRTITLGRSRYRQQHPHRGSDADLELDFNDPAALSDKSLDLTETRTLPNRLRRENWSRTLAEALRLPGSFHFPRR